MNTEKLREIQIDRSQRQRPQGPFWMILFVVILVTSLGVYFAWPKKGDDRRIVDKMGVGTSPAPSPTPQVAAASGDYVLTVSGYIVNRARIEISPRFEGTVKWIGVKKGDHVAKDQVVATLDDAEQRALLLQAQGRLATVKTRLEKARLDYERAKKLRLTNVESQKIEDDARIEVAAAQAAIDEMQGAYDYAKTQLDWTVIRSPIDGVVLEKLVDPGELVMPQSFGGTRGPSTAIFAVADPNDLQVEIDVNETDLSKIYPDQKCRVSPEAYPDKFYEGFVSEMAPEANRQKGTLQLKVQIKNPDRYLTPELSARVDFLKP